MVRSRKIAIIGPFPPPYGGISVHVQRVVEHLISLGVPHELYLESRNSNFDGPHRRFYGKANKLLSLTRLFLSRYGIIHHHAPNTSTRLALCFLGLAGKKNIFLHVHGKSLQDAVEKRGINSYLLKKMLGNVNVLADNEDIAALSRNLHARDVKLIDAFLPPVYNDDVLTAFRKRYTVEKERYDLVIGAVGWFSSYEGQDLYGFDLLLDAVSSLSTKYNILTIASINGVTSKEIHRTFQKGLDDTNLGDNFILIYDELDEIWPLYLTSDVFVRATNTDGNALSIKEALWFETPVIASDCVDRPEGITLFRSRSAESLSNRIEEYILSCDRRQTLDEKCRIAANKIFENKLFREVYGIT